MFKPGDRVICVDSTISPEQAPEIARNFLIWVEKDQEYTVREILDNKGIVTGILLEEIHNFPVYIKVIDTVQEPAFAIWRFRKLNHASVSEEKEEDELDLILEEIGIETSKETIKL